MSKLGILEVHLQLDYVAQNFHKMVKFKLRT